MVSERGWLLAGLQRGQVWRSIVIMSGHTCEKEDLLDHGEQHSGRTEWCEGTTSKVL